MNKVLIVLLTLSFSIGFGQKKPVVKKEPDNEAVASPEVKRPIKSNKNIASDPNANHVKGDSEVSAKKEISDYSQIFTSVELPAKPVEGTDAYRKQIVKSFRLTEIDEPVTATIVARFVVWDDGSIRDIVIVKETPSGLGLGKEYVRILKESQKWSPAQISKKNVKQYYTLAITFQIPAFEESSQLIEEIKAKSETNLSKENKEEAIIRQFGNQPEESSTDQGPDYTQIFTSVQVSAQPPGGMNAFRQMIGSSFRVPVVYETTMGTVIAKFVVWDDGSIRDIVIVKESPANLGLGKEAIRVISSSDKWTPGIYDGRAVKQYYTLPFAIQITPAEKKGKPVEEAKKD